MFDLSSAGLLAPLAAFATVTLFVTGLYRTLNQGGLLARRRVAAYAPDGVGARALEPIFEGGILLGRRRLSSIATLDRLLQGHLWGVRLSIDLARAGLPLRVGEYVLIRIAFAVILALAAMVKFGSPLLSVPLAVVGYVGPSLYVRGRTASRLRQFDDQLVDALTLIANSLKSGYSFLQGLEAVARESIAPLGPEFEQVIREIRVGGSTEEALMKLSQRIGSADLELVVTAMLIQRQVGGNLAEILSNIAHTVRERHRIVREVRVLTAQERLSGNIVAALPVVMVILLSITTPAYLSGMWAATSGKILLLSGGVCELLGLFAIRKLVELEV